jgi:hypothetical protein
MKRDSLCTLIRVFPVSMWTIERRVSLAIASRSVEATARLSMGLKAAANCCVIGDWRDVVVGGMSCRRRNGPRLRIVGRVVTGRIFGGGSTLALEQRL